MLSPVIFLLVACVGFGNGLMGAFRFKPHSDYVYSIHKYSEVDYVTVDGVNISRPHRRGHCCPPNDCYQEVNSTNHFMISGRLSGENAYMVLQPADPMRHSVALLWKRNDTQYNELPEGVMAASTNSLLDREATFQVIQWTGRVANVSYHGKFSTNRVDYSMLTVFGTFGIEKRDSVIFTGRLTNKVRRMVIYFKNGVIYNITITPVDDLGTSRAIYTFIDFNRAFKKQ